MKLPHIRPVPPKKKREPFDDPEWLFEQKYDGFRGICYCANGRCILVSRHDKRLPFPDLENRLSACLSGKSVILDGEVCSLNKKGYPDLIDLLSRKGHIVYIAFDILWLDGKDLTNLPLQERKEILQQFAIEETGACLQVSSWIQGKGGRLYRLACQRRIEGIIAKRLAGTYSRRTEWLKIINPKYKRSKKLPTFFKRY